MSVAGAYSSPEPASASATVTAVYERLLDEILTGVRKGGDLIHDRDIATEFSVSRTPVREAIQMLRSLGIVEASASRYTRVAQLGPEDIVQSARLLLSLYDEVLKEVLTADGDLPLEEMERMYSRAVDAAARSDFTEFWSLVFGIHNQLFRRCANPHLLRAVRTVSYALRVAVVTNRDRFDTSRILVANREILDALAARDADLVRNGMRTFLQIGEDLSGRPVDL